MNLRRFVYFGISLGILLLGVDQVSAFSTNTDENKKETVSLAVPWSNLAPDILGKKIKATNVLVQDGNKKWTLSLSFEKTDVSTRRFVQFMDFELPLEDADALGKFGIVEKKILTMQIQPLLDQIEKKIASDVNQQGKSVTIKKEKDVVTFDGVGIDGQAVDERALLALIYDTLEQQNGEVRVDLPTTTVPAKVQKVGLDDVHVEELITTGVTDFGNSPKNRIVNIRVGLERFNGTIIKQGDTFSFNDQLGPVDGEHGFLPELVILGPKTEKEFGGGLCQVSSTMFQAALLGGLQIKERKNHSYAVQYYKWPLGWGNDATIYPGVQDMKFVNDTPGDIIVQAYIEGTKVYYKFYGISDHRSVALTTPVTYNHRGPPDSEEIPVTTLPVGKSVIKEKAHEGFTASFDRTVIMPDGKELKNTFVSVYQARPQVTQVGVQSNANTNVNAPYNETYYTGDTFPSSHTPTPSPVASKSPSSPKPVAASPTPKTK